MKRTLYIFCFSALGALLGVVAESLLEAWHSSLVLDGRLTLGLTTDSWLLIYFYALLSFVFAGSVWGNHQGKKWWRILYVEQRYKRFGKPLKKEF